MDEEIHLPPTHPSLPLLHIYFLSHISNLLHNFINQHDYVHHPTLGDEQEVEVEVERCDTRVECIQGSYEEPSQWNKREGGVYLNPWTD